MFLKILKPIHNSIRNKIIICKNHLSKKNIIKKLVYGMKKNAGRNKLKNARIKWPVQFGTGSFVKAKKLFNNESFSKIKELINWEL